MNPVVFRVFGFVGAAFWSACALERGGTSEGSVLSSDRSPTTSADAGQPVLLDSADAGREDDNATEPSQEPSLRSCRYRDATTGAEVCRGYTDAIFAASRRADCQTLSGAPSALGCVETNAVATCDTPTGRDFVLGARCSGLSEGCLQQQGKWTCLRDDPDTFGNDQTNVVSCGPSSSACDLAGNVCCVKSYSDDGASCVSGSTCPMDETPIPCDGPEDCGNAGEVCCIEVKIQTLFVDATAVGQCIPADECRFDWNLAGGGGRLELRVCHQDADCPRDQTCQSSGNFSWWGTCQ